MDNEFLSELKKQIEALENIREKIEKSFEIDINKLATRQYKSLKESNYARDNKTMLCQGEPLLPCKVEDIPLDENGNFIFDPIDSFNL